MGALAADDTLLVSPLFAEKTAAELFKPVFNPPEFFEPPLLLLVVPKPPIPPIPPEPPNIPEPPKTPTLLLGGGGDGAGLRGPVPGAPTPIGDFDGEGGATGSPLVSKCVLTEDGNAGLLPDILVEGKGEGGGGELFLLFLFNHTTSILVYIFFSSFFLQTNY